MTTLSIGSIVRVKATIAPSGAMRREFGRTLLITDDDSLSAARRVGVFADLEAVAELFEPDTSPYQAARTYFSQSPYPKNLVIGRWVSTNAPARLIGGAPSPLLQLAGSPTKITGTGTVADLDTFRGRATVLTGTGTVADLVNFHGRATVLTGTGTVADLVNFHGRATVLTGTGTVADLVNFHGRATVLTGTGTVASLTTLQGITSGSVTFLGQTVTGLDFSSDTDLDGVASTLQTALRATSSTDLDNVEVVYDSTASAFVVTLPLDSSGVVPTVSAAFTGDDADELGLDTATIVNGVDAIVSGTVTFLGQTLTGLDFSAVTDYDDVASVLQAGLRGTSETDLDNVEVAYDSTASAFVITIPLDSSGEATTVSAAFTGDDADELGLDTATIVNGVDAIVSGTVTFLGQTVTGLDFSDVTDYDDVAAVLQTALRATSATSLDEVELSYVDGGFVVTVPLDSSGAATSVSAAFIGSESDELGLDTATIVDGVSAIQSGTVTLLDETFSGLDFSAVTDHDGVAAVLQAGLRGTSETDLDNVEVAYDSTASAFVVTLPLDSNGAATSVSAAFTGSESVELGLDTATIVDGVSAIQSGTVTLLDETFSGLDFSNVSSHDDVASILQAALRATSETALDNVEVVHDGTQFVVTVPLDSDGSATSVTDPFTGDNADELGLDTVDIDQGVDGIGNGSISWQSVTVAGLDFTDATSYADVASALQTALRAAVGPGLSTATVLFNASRQAFEVALGFDSSGAPYIIADVFSGTDADSLGLDESSATQLIAGEAAEPIEDAMVSIRAADHSWYFVAVDSQTGDIQSRMDLAAWVDTEQSLLGLDILGQEVLVAGESSSLAALLSNLEYERTFLVWSESGDNKALSLMARLSSVNFEGANTLITAKFKSLPGTQPDILNTAGQAELDRKRVNYYTRFGLDSIFAEGYTLKPGAWIDVRYWLDWIVGEIQTSVYNLLRTHPTRLPQTDPGIASIKAEINGVCEAGIRNGGIAPGRVSEAIAHDIRQATGNLDFSGRLTRGYLVYSSPVATLTDADRAARRSPPFRVWLTGSGAVHFATIELTFAN